MADRTQWNQRQDIVVASGDTLTLGRASFGTIGTFRIGIRVTGGADVDVQAKANGAPDTEYANCIYQDIYSGGESAAQISADTTILVTNGACIRLAVSGGGSATFTIEAERG